MPDKKPKLDDEKTENLKDKALDYIRRYSSDGGELKQNREDALKAYRRDPYPEDAKIPEGSRSKFVMSDLSDVIESILPSLARIFTGGKEVVRIEGRGPEDTKGAELLNDKVNWDLVVQNNGFLLFHDWFKAALLNKFSVVKYWWESREEYEDEDYDGVAEEEAAQLMEDQNYVMDDVKMVASDMPMADPSMMMMAPPPTYNIKGRRIKKRIRRPVAEVVPPEEIICSIKMRDIKKEEFVAHRIKKHKDELIKEYGVKEDDIDAELAIWTSLGDDSDSEIYERFKDLGGVGFFQDEDDKDFYYIYECCLKDEDRKPIILTLMGTKTVRKEPNTYGHPNYCMLSPIRMPHRAIGHSMFDMVGDLHKLDSALVRYLFNNIYYQTENMAIVNPWKVNIADFVTQQRPGGKIRTKAENVNPSEAYFPLPPQPLAGHAFGLLDTLTSWRERRTGVTSYNQGLDADSLNKTARGISEIMAASQQRVEMIARIFAETGVRDLVMAFAEMNVEFLDLETNVRLDQGWLEIPDPKAMDVLFDVTVDVALGTGSKEVKMQQLLGMIDRALNPLMIATGVIQKSNIYQMWRTIFIEMGEKNTEKYLTDPATLVPVLPPAPPGAPPMPGGMNGNLQGAMGAGPGANGAPPAGLPQGSPTIQ